VNHSAYLVAAGRLEADAGRAYTVGERIGSSRVIEGGRQYSMWHKATIVYWCGEVSLGGKYHHHHHHKLLTHSAWTLPCPACRLGVSLIHK